MLRWCLSKPHTGTYYLRINARNVQSKLRYATKPIESSNAVYNQKSFELQRMAKTLDFDKLIDSFAKDKLPLMFPSEASQEKASNDVLHVYHYAAAHNRINLLKKCVKKYPQLLTNKEFLYDALMFATMNNSNNILEFLADKASQKQLDQLLRNYVGSMTMQTFKFFIDNGCDFYQAYDQILITGGDVLDEIVKMTDPTMISQKLFDRISFRYACDNNLHMLQYIFSWPNLNIEYGSLINQSIICNRTSDIPAAVLYLLECKCGKENYDKYLETIIQCGIANIDIFARTVSLVKYLILLGGKTQHPRLLADYASMGNYDMVEWLINHGVDPINDDAYVQAALGRHNKIIKLLIEKGNKARNIDDSKNRHQIKKEAELRIWRNFYY